MKENRIVWLILGTVFWGIILALLINFLFPDKNFAKLIIEYVVFTGILTLVMQFYSGGFIILTPKKWFFIPLACWVIMIIWGVVEITLLGEWASF
jgi:hypothetical protein